MLKPLLIHLTEKQFDLVSGFCKENDISKSELIRRLLEKQFDINPLEKNGK